jgi:hypothetical protein
MQCNISSYNFSAFTNLLCPFHSFFMGQALMLVATAGAHLFSSRVTDLSSQQVYSFFMSKSNDVLSYFNFETQ